MAGPVLIKAAGVAAKSKTGRKILGGVLGAIVASVIGLILAVVLALNALASLVGATLSLDAENPDGPADHGSGALSIERVVPAKHLDAVRAAAEACDSRPEGLVASILTHTFVLTPDDDPWPLEAAATKLQATGRWTPPESAASGDGTDSEVAGVTDLDRIAALGVAWCESFDAVKGFADVEAGEDYAGAHLVLWLDAASIADNAATLESLDGSDNWSKQWKKYSTIYAASAATLGFYLPGYSPKLDEALEAGGPALSSDGTYRVHPAGQVSGRLDPATLCPVLGTTTTLMRCDAAASLAQFNAAFTAKFGASMASCGGPSCAYRTYDQQVQTAYNNRYTGLAAPAGTSIHGWGLAMDFSPSTHGGSYTSEKYLWMRENSRTFGWDHPSWARQTGYKPEIWHWEYIGVRS